MGLVGHLEPDKPRLRARVHSCFLDVWGGGVPRNTKEAWLSARRESPWHFLLG